MAAERAEPLIVIGVVARAHARALCRRAGRCLPRQLGRARAIRRQGARRRAPRWCDDVRTPRAETCDELLAESLDRALGDLRSRYGADPRMALGRSASRRSTGIGRLAAMPCSRGSSTSRCPPRATPTPSTSGRTDFNDDAAPYANRHAASLRAIYDLADPQASLFIHSGGQSGNPLSPHYRSFAHAWARGEYIRALTDRQRLEALGVQRLVLTPRK